MCIAHALSSYFIKLHIAEHRNNTKKIKTSNLIIHEIQYVYTNNILFKYTSLFANDLYLHDQSSNRFTRFFFFNFVVMWLYLNKNFIIYTMTFLVIFYFIINLVITWLHVSSFKNYLVFVLFAYCSTCDVMFGNFIFFVFMEIQIVKKGLTN